MIARRESSVRARTSSGLAPGAATAMASESLASAGGHRPSMAESHSGRASARAAGVQAGGSAARRMASAPSESEAKKVLPYGLPK